jgi:hypothetical protein
MKAASPRPAEAVSEDGLRQLRVPFFQRGTLTAPGGEEELFIVDLGQSGAFAERLDPLPVGQRVHLRFALPGNAIPVVVTCRVAWWHPPGGRLVSKDLPAGLGLEFVELSDADRRKLRGFIASYLRRDTRLRRFHRPRPLDEDGGD